MTLQFKVIESSAAIASPALETIYLAADDWDDFGYKTLFSVYIFSKERQLEFLGNIKIGYMGQHGGRTVDNIPKEFESLPETFYSLGQDADFYKTLTQKLDSEIVTNLLTALGDLALDNTRLQSVEAEEAFTTSLLRTVDRSSVENQFKRILNGDAPLTHYRFGYEKPATELFSGIKVTFSVHPGSTPPTNIHVVIGRNGVGKTTLLQNMAADLAAPLNENSQGRYFNSRPQWGEPDDLQRNYFSGVVSVSFSAFDSFTHFNNTAFRSRYVGLKKENLNPSEQATSLKDKEDLARDFSESLKVCLALVGKRNRWRSGVQKLESDANFAEMNLTQLIVDFDEDRFDSKVIFLAKAEKLFKRMSSGHAIVLLTITSLVESVEEKTLVLIDEPESHLHPPLLSAFTRSLSDLLTNRNAVAIIATHSPVVLQEVPKSCVSVLRRTGLEARVERLEKETFAENMGALTREVFGLEVSKSGFHNLLRRSAEKSESYEAIKEEYRHQLGTEGELLLRSMLELKRLNSSPEE